MKKVDSSRAGWICFSVHLVPRAAHREITGWTGEGTLKVKVTAPPVENAANQELIRFLSKTLAVKKSEVHIESGMHSRKKLITVPEECKNRLLSFTDI